MVLRYVLDRRHGPRAPGVVHDLRVRPLPTVIIGVVGGLIVGMTSVGSGSLMIVLLLFLYPMLGANQLVGTDLTQAVPLTVAAALGALAFGHIEFSVTTSLIIGSVPAVLVGSFLSSRAPDRYIRPAITFVIFASGLKYVGVSTTALGWILCIGAAAAPSWSGWRTCGPGRPVRSPTNDDDPNRTRARSPDGPTGSGRPVGRGPAPSRPGPASRWAGRRAAVDIRSTAGGSCPAAAAPPWPPTGWCRRPGRW